MTTPERQLEDQFIEKLQGLKYEYRADIRDRAALEKNFRDKFEALNHIHLTDGEFQRLLDEIVTPDVFTAAHTLRNRSSLPATTALRSTTPWSTSPNGAKTPSRPSASSASTPTTAITATTSCC